MVEVGGECYLWQEDTTRQGNSAVGHSSTHNKNFPISVGLSLSKEGSVTGHLGGGVEGGGQGIDLA